jgi:glutathione S-transferase
MPESSGDLFEIIATTLHHIINSVSAQKVRMALHKKGPEAKEHLMTLAGEAVPTLMHDGYPVVESSVILYYIDGASPEPLYKSRGAVCRLHYPRRLFGAGARR